MNLEERGRNNEKRNMRFFLKRTKSRWYDWIPLTGIIGVFLLTILIVFWTFRGVNRDVDLLFEGIKENDQQIKACINSGGVPVYGTLQINMVACKFEVKK